ncbi:MAG: GAF domain-containing protein [Planctomycetes bacterium]|nr:GAF domain-containing protein [Planctomycetota bacterium]
MFVKKAWKNMSAFLRQPLLQSKELYSLNKKLRTEIKDRQRTEEAFRSLAEATSFQFGSAFFDSMVVQLSKTLGADCTLIGEVQGNQSKVIRTLALAVDGEITGNVEYYLPGTPCENIMEKSICSYVSGVAEKFPKDTMLKQMGMEGYVGVPLFDSQGGALGIMAALFRKPIANAEFTEAILQIFSSRTGSELERLRSDKALVASEARYKAILEAEPDLMFQLSEDGVHLDFYASSLDKLYIDPKEFLGKRVNETVVIPSRSFLRGTL